MSSPEEQVVESQAIVAAQAELIIELGGDRRSEGAVGEGLGQLLGAAVA